jgi:murein DD-endopeptidase MepM/ murein hydrolase activator NlpD
MRIIILISIVLLVAGCASAPPYTGPVIPAWPQAVSGVHHRVEAGQTLWRISKLYDVDIEEILRVNHISEEAKIEPGQLLLIPSASRPQNIIVRSGGDDFIWPLKGRVITGFGLNYRNLMNKGINIQALMGAQVFATRTGRVVFCADNLGNFGKTIIIDHGDGLRSVYSRVAQSYVRLGDMVQGGSAIGSVGISARDKNSYLHFEIRKGALPQNPLFYLP